MLGKKISGIELKKINLMLAHKLLMKINVKLLQQESIKMLFMEYLINITIIINIKIRNHSMSCIKEVIQNKNLRIFQNLIWFFKKMMISQ